MKNGCRNFGEGKKKTENMNSKKAIKIWTAVLIKECAGKTATEQKKMILRLKEILKAKKRDYLLPRIVTNALAEMKKQARFELVLAMPHAKETLSKLEDKLAGSLDVVDDADIKIDPAIIGGFVARTEQFLVDASIKGQIEQLRKLKA
jgi:F0F1-type ATP synthase delta subunit